MKIALIQMTSGPDVLANLDYLESRLREAAKAGAVFIATPENSDFMMEGGARKLAAAHDEQSHPFLPRMAALARELKVTILLGSIAIRLPQGKLHNRSYMFLPTGDVAAAYNKIHLFDVDLPSGESRRESDNVVAGTDIVMADTDFARVGMSICYDVRFPQLYRQMARQGAAILSIPAAFTVSTGKMHWEILLRARAIENGAFVVAPAQCGVHDGGRMTYGHSMIVDPWGKIIAVAGDDPTILYADIDMDEVSRFRQAIPSLSGGVGFGE